MSDSPADEAVENIVNAITQRVQDKHEGIEQAAREIQKMGVPTGYVTAAVDLLNAELEKNARFSDSVISNAARTGLWYLGPQPDGEWAKYRKKWEKSGKPGLDYLDESTTRITGLLANPSQRGTRKGLVMGNVQSGKTGNFAGVIAKAADAGYRVVIVLAGIYNNLRAQTQLRLEHDVFGNEWELRTDDENDLGVLRNPARNFKTHQLTALVVKKNPTRLANLRDALQMLPEEHLRQLPILIIDDEADQATPNSPSKQAEISTINGLMREIWKEVEVGTYVAYTATPFANVLMDVDDKGELFPSDFITSLKPGPAYFGAERVFGIADGVDDDGNQVNADDGLDMVRKVPDADVDAMRPPGNAEDREDFIPPLVDSLADAVRWFLIATAVRRLRNDQRHSSMLVHTTHFAAPHMAMQKQLEKWLARQESSPLDEERYRKLWEAEKDKVELGDHAPTDWADIHAKLPEVIASVKVIVDNGRSTDRLDYTKGDGQTVIAVGGGTLSRGLTLEGLVVSYFTRTSNTYDTLMQMGRWFGYRDGYEDLPRVWVSKGLDKDYAFLARVERDLRDEIESIEGSELTPAQVGIKVRHHPGRLDITSVNRMKNAKLVEVTLSGTMRQSFILDGSPEVTRSNHAAIEHLLGGRATVGRGGRLEATATSSDIATFLAEFRAHEDQRTLQAPEQQEAMQDWLKKFGGGASWSVIVTNNSAADARERLGATTIAGHEVLMVNRAPLAKSTAQRLDFKAVMSPGDWIADIPDSAFNGPKPQNGPGRLRARRTLAHNKGLVVIYPISEKSQPSPGTHTRTDMPEGIGGPIYAFAIIFPTIDDREGTEGTFVAVRPNPNAVVEEYEDDDVVEDTEGSLGDDDE